MVSDKANEYKTGEPLSHSHDSQGLILDDWIYKIENSRYTVP